MKIINKLDSPITVNLNGIGETTFRYASEMKEWAETENKIWSEVSSKLNEDLLFPKNLHSFNNELSNARQIINHVNTALTQTEINNFTHKIAAAIKSLNYFASIESLCSASQSAQRIIKLADIDPKAAWFAVAEARNQPVTHNHVNNLIPLIKAAQIAYHSDMDVDIAVKKQRVALGNLKGQWGRRLEKLTQEFDDITDQAMVKMRLHRKAAITRAKRHDAEIADHEERMQTMEREFSTEMSLRASEKFWDAKKKVNNIRATKAFELLINVGGYGLGVVLFVYVILAWILDVSDKPNVLHGFAFALPTLSYIWLLKIFAREYRINKDMADDAEERIAMVKAFKALEHEKKVGDEERLVILNALFRPHNHVADDSAPSPIWDAVIKKLDR